MKNKQKLKINITLQELYLTTLKKALHVLLNHSSFAWHVSGFPIP